MADLFPRRLEACHRHLSGMHPDKMDVPPERRFTGFDAYRKAIDQLRPGDIATLTGYAGFRPAQLEYAVEKGVHVFMEKSFARDRPHNEARRAALSNPAMILGRAAVHSGKVVTWDEAMASEFRFFPDIDRLTEDSPPPIEPDAQGRYPVPVPGSWSEL